MDDLHLVSDGRRDDVVNVEVGAEGLAGFADRVGLVRLEAVQGEAVLMRDRKSVV